MLLLHSPVAFGKNCTQTIYLCTKSQTPVFCLKSGDVPGFVFVFFPEMKKAAGCRPGAAATRYMEMLTS